MMLHDSLTFLVEALLLAHTVMLTGGNETRLRDEYYDSS
jgi:hypothetical protein